MDKNTHPLFQTLALLELADPSNFPPSESDAAKKYITEHTGPFETKKQEIDGLQYWQCQIRKMEDGSPVCKIQIPNATGEWYISLPAVIETFPGALMYDARSYYPESKDSVMYYRVWVAPLKQKKCGNCDKDHGVISIRFVQDEKKSIEALSDHAYSFVKSILDELKGN